MDFVILDMEGDLGIPLILGRPFLKDTNARIDVGRGRISLYIRGKTMKFKFQNKKEQCLMIRVKFGPNPQKIKEIEVTPSQKDSLIPFMKTLMKEDSANSKRSKKKGKSKDPVPAPPTPPKKTKKVWRKKNKTSLTATTSPGTDEMTST